MPKSIDYGAEIELLKQNVNLLYKISFVFWIIFMQCGFAFLEAGSVRSKNTTNILFKNILDMLIGAIVFWAFGFAFIKGIPGNGFIGHNHFFGTFLKKATRNASSNNYVNFGLLENEYYPEFVYHFAFAVTSSTIVSGALAERTQFGCYIVYSFIITGFIYPVVAHWTWTNDGWLYNGAGTGIRFKDFAGSATVHVVGGTVSLVGVYLIGPREGRFLKASSGSSLLLGHSIPLTCLGGFILIVGFLAFNSSSFANISDPEAGVKVAMVITNTLLSGSSGSLIATLLMAGLNKMTNDRIHWSLLNAINGCLTGMVAICAGADVVYPWAAVVIGIIAGTAYILWDMTMEKIKIDDPLSAVSVHLGGGLTGSLTVSFFAHEGLLINDPGVKGIIYNWNKQVWGSFAWNLLGTFCIFVWSAFTSGLVFITLKLVGLYRVPISQERQGLDISHHEIAYPETATVELLKKTRVGNRNKVCPI